MLSEKITKLKTWFSKNNKNLYFKKRKSPLN